MAVELDHLFFCVSPGAPEGEHLLRFGWCEGPPNVHTGQGTANRRFFFRNAMLELLWVENPLEAQSEQTAPTRLWERWCERRSGACPFGIIVRPADEEAAAAPFPGVQYRPAWVAPGWEVHLSEAGLQEPMWVYMPFLRRVDQERRFVAHPNGACDVTRLTLTTPVPWRSPAAAAMVENAVLSTVEGPEYLVTIEFDHGLRQEARDFQPHLPLVVQL
jgi:hypothetical protein